MTTSPVISITDELLAEIEAAASDSKLNIYRPLGWAHSVRCGNHLQTDFDFLSLASPETVLALLAHIADLKQQVVAAGVTAENCEVFRKDAERYRWLKSEAATGSLGFGDWWIDSVDMASDLDAAIDAAIDAAMEAGQ